jgi:indole-3-glycerol phosphate synthase
MILDEIMAVGRRRLVEAKAQTRQSELEAYPRYKQPRRGFAAALRGRRPAIIAEVKKASPSKGIIRPDFDPVGVARSYAHAGAAAVSVLTEPEFFQGRLSYLAAIRGAIELPLLRKDFLFDVYQVIEARAWGADAVLLIVAVLDDRLLRELLATASALGLDALVEVHSEDEVDRAAAAGATLIGVNNRDLRTFVTSLATAERLRSSIPASAIAIAESGIETVADVNRLRCAGFDAFLIGEAFMRAPDPGAALRGLLEELRTEN